MAVIHVAAAACRRDHNGARKCHLNAGAQVLHVIRRPAPVVRSENDRMTCPACQYGDPRPVVPAHGKAGQHAVDRPVRDAAVARKAGVAARGEMQCRGARCRQRIVKHRDAGGLERIEPARVVGHPDAPPHRRRAAMGMGCCDHHLRVSKRAARADSRRHVSLDSDDIGDKDRRAINHQRTHRQRIMGACRGFRPSAETRHQQACGRCHIAQGGAGPHLHPITLSPASQTSRKARRASPGA